MLHGQPPRLNHATSSSALPGVVRYRALSHHRERLIGTVPTAVAADVAHTARRTARAGKQVVAPFPFNGAVI